MFKATATIEWYDGEQQVVEEEFKTKTEAEAFLNGVLYLLSGYKHVGMVTETNTGESLEQPTS